MGFSFGVCWQRFPCTSGTGSFGNGRGKRANPSAASESRRAARMRPPPLTRTKWKSMGKSTGPTKTKQYKTKQNKKTCVSTTLGMRIWEDGDWGSNLWFGEQVPKSCAGRHQKVLFPTKNRNVEANIHPVGKGKGSFPCWLNNEGCELQCLW